MSVLQCGFVANEMSVPVERYCAAWSIRMTRACRAGGAYYWFRLPGGRAARVAHGVERQGQVGDGVLRRAAELLPRVEPGWGEKEKD